MYDHTLYDTREGVAFVTINRLEKRPPDFSRFR